MIIGRRRLTHLISRNKKLQIWHRRFGHVNNARIIQASKLLTEMGELGTTYNSVEIYNNSKASKPENVNPELESNVETNVKSNTKSNIPLRNTLQVSRITDFGSDFNEICKPCIGNNQTHVIR